MFRKMFIRKISSIAWPPCLPFIGRIPEVLHGMSADRFPISLNVLGFAFLQVNAKWLDCDTSFEHLKHICPMPSRERRNVHQDSLCSQINLCHANANANAI